VEETTLKQPRTQNTAQQNTMFTIDSLTKEETMILKIITPLIGASNRELRAKGNERLKQILNTMSPHRLVAETYVDTIFNITPDEEQRIVRREKPPARAKRPKR